MTYQELLEDIAVSYRDILKDNLVGIYVHGSIAMKCFHWNKSDIDFIVVVNDRLSPDIKLKLMETIGKLNPYAPLKGFEMSVVLMKYCRDFKYPTPFELHYSAMHLAWYRRDAADYCKNMQGEDKDLAAHFTIIRKCGIVLCGKPAEEVFGPVLKDYYLDSIKSDIEAAASGIMENPVYYVLNLCRVLAYVKEELVLSKEQGGKWGRDNLDRRYQDLIARALRCYQTDETMTADKKETEAFCKYMLKEINLTKA
jgi:streptomycin 3"-adenylyltransferase